MTAKVCEDGGRFHIKQVFFLCKSIILCIFAQSFSYIEEKFNAYLDTFNRDGWRCFFV